MKIYVYEPDTMIHIATIEGEYNRPLVQYFEANFGFNNGFDFTYNPEFNKKFGLKESDNPDIIKI